MENGELRVKSKMSGMNVQDTDYPFISRIDSVVCSGGQGTKQHSTTDESARESSTNKR